MISSVSTKIKALSAKGFFHIFGANVVNKIIAFFTNIVIVWFLAKDDYGIFCYANNIYSIVMLLTGLGLLSGMFQFCLEDRKEEQRAGLYRYVLTRGLFIDGILALIVLGIGLLIPLSIEQAGKYLAVFGPLIILDYVFQYASTVLRIHLENKLYARLQIINTVTYFIAACLGAYLGGIYGTIAGRYIAYVISFVFAIAFLLQSGFIVVRGECIDRDLKFDLWRYSVSTQLSAGMNTFTYLFDVFLVGYFIQSASLVATYKVATLLPEGFSFIPASVIVFALPYFVKHNNDRKWFSDKCRYFLSIGAGLYGVIALCLALFAPWIIELLWGGAYLDAVLPFRILAVSFFFNAIRTTCTNLLCAVRAIRSNLAISIISLVVNIVLCLLLIPAYGVEGAALAPLSVSVIAAGIALVLLYRSIKKIPEAKYV